MTVVAQLLLRLVLQTSTVPMRTVRPQLDHRLAAPRMPDETTRAGQAQHLHTYGTVGVGVLAPLPQLLAIVFRHAIFELAVQPFFLVLQGGKRKVMPT